MIRRMGTTDLPSNARARSLPLSGMLLVKLGRREEARGEFERAAELTQNARERELLTRRALACTT